MSESSIDNCVHDYLIEIRRYQLRGTTPTLVGQCTQCTKAYEITKDYMPWGVHNLRGYDIYKRKDLGGLSENE